MNEVENQLQKLDAAMNVVHAFSQGEEPFA